MAKGFFEWSKTEYPEKQWRVYFTGKELIITTDSVKDEKYYSLVAGGTDLEEALTNILALVIRTQSFVGFS